MLCIFLPVDPLLGSKIPPLLPVLLVPKVCPCAAPVDTTFCAKCLLGVLHRKIKDPAQQWRAAQWREFQETMINFKTTVSSLWKEPSRLQSDYTIVMMKGLSLREGP